VWKRSVFVPFSYEVGMDAVNFTSEVSKLLTDAADQLQAAAYMNGSGTGQPKGITVSLPAGSKVATTTADVLVAADILKPQNALPPRFQKFASHLANLPTINSTASFETTSGSLRFPEVANNEFLRKPLLEASALKTAGSTAGAGNDPVLLYGAFESFVIVDRIGTTVELAPNLFGAAGRPTGQRGLFMWFRTGRYVVVPDAFRLLTA
jgi:HK97 family phage major capsid protein